MPYKIFESSLQSSQGRRIKEEKGGGGGGQQRGALIKGKTQAAEGSL